MVTRKKDGGKKLGVWDGQVHTAIFKMDNQQGPPVEHRGLCSVLRGSLEGRGLGGEWVPVSV